MSDFKDQMLEAYERGWCGYYDAYDFVRERYADAADLERKQRKEGITRENNPDEYEYLRREQKKESQISEIGDDEN